MAGNNKLKYQFEEEEADAVVAVLLISLTKACVVQWGVFNLVINSELGYCPGRSIAEQATIPHSPDKFIAQSLGVYLCRTWEIHLENLSSSPLG